MNELTTNERCLRIERTAFPASERTSLNNQQLLLLMNELWTFNELCKINQGCLQSTNELCTINELLVNNDGHKTIIIIIIIV